MTRAPRPLQFAAVREDPRIEERLLRMADARHVLLVGSGGCTALYLRARFPGLPLTVVEPNPAQVDHLAHKLEALARFDPARFNVGNADSTGLQECGNFETLFRLFRGALDLFVIPADQRESRCGRADSDWSDVIAHPYWPVAFAVAFGDEILRAMFGPGAVQHASPGSYPRYFRARIEAGLAAGDCASNPWLHHVLLGKYLPHSSAWPPFLRSPPADLGPFPVIAAPLLEVASFAPFDFVHLSNVMDWMDDDGCRALARRLGAELPPGARVLWRQLNDPRDLMGLFADEFEFSAALDAELTADERSLFYNQVHAGTKRFPPTAQ
ncbi:MAG: DUF3419 family protein [Planctomycetes bacterium]|nr:DUF3419 family protein [Planctomycetota bacterium]MCB9868793.1 DUF3419 family protein [Planctomycetota bacterium]